MIGTSAGGVEAILHTVAGLHADNAAAVLVVIHVPPHGISHLPDVISREGQVPAKHAVNGEPIGEGRISVAPPALSRHGLQAPLNEYHLQLDDREWVVLHAGVVLTYDDELAFLRTQRQHTPYGVALWPSSIALAYQLALLGDGLAGLRVLELGAGTGLPGIVAASFGAAVTQTDRHELAMSICRQNAEANGATGIHHRIADWTDWPIQDSFDLIVGSDILYPEALHPSLGAIFDSCLAPRGRLLLSDPFRAMSVRYLCQMEENGWNVAGTRWNLGSEEDPRPIGVFELRQPAAAVA